MTDGKCFCSERCVGKPANVGRAARAIKTVAADKAEVKEQAAKGGEPEAPGVEAGKSHIASADHKRDEVIAKAEQDRHSHKKDHGGAMHGEHAVKGLRRDEVVVGNDKLETHDGGFDAADHEEQDGVQNIKDAEAFVVNSGDPGIESVAKRARGLPDGSERNGLGGHRAIASLSSKGLQIGGDGFQILVA